MDDHPHDGPECAGCDWEGRPEAFRWFPELGRPLEPVGGGGPARAA